MGLLIIECDIVVGTDVTYLLTAYILQSGSVSYLERKQTNAH
jgi:hypothetical protein